ncbi:short-chain dehydrogenase/reductase SDR [Labilithrix luteola]|uniref:Short-chain dehydrogenase/reductase SDR n=1 Tax=Labilithrix luteola TaxID=1391654 RepID=A0A0K1PWU7_9BACT|nr:SDR family NAD(P)-dependent oxidoreductase [Labilithrix luteola]AKU98005.1 short-chain dehydrogenase/reductase SDR [Labilithrix luteola]
MHVVVTGASSGIGEAIAREYGKRGAKLTLVARRRELLDRLASEVGTERTNVVQADLANPANVNAWVDEAEQKLGPIDVLVNNAGVQIVKSATATTWEEAERLLLLDLHTPLKLTHHVLKRMLERKRGTIVDVASVAAIAPTPGMFFYNAAKGGLAAASEGLRAEVKDHGVHVVTVYPGPVKSAMEEAGRAAYEDTPASRYTPTGSPDVLARLIAEAVEKKRPRVVYPRLYFLVRHFPNATRWALDTLTPPLKRLPK